MNIPNSVLLSHLRSLSAARQGSGAQSDNNSHGTLSGSSTHLPRHMDLRLTNPLQQLSAAYQLIGSYNAPSVPHGILPPAPDLSSIISVSPIASIPSVPPMPSMPVPQFSSVQQPAPASKETVVSPTQIDKKILKRAANRKSAQLSRKRKKAFVDDLKAENEMLKRNKDILDCIPDLVFAFDALTGKVVFASNSVYQCLQVPTARLLSLSIFNLVTESSAQKLKDMLDKICSMQPTSELRIDLPKRIDLCFLTKYMTRVWGELDGVVQFKDDQVECICSFRPAARNPVLMSGFGPPTPRTNDDDQESGGSEDTRSSAVTSVADESCSTSSSYSHSQEDSDDNPNGRSNALRRTTAQNSTQTNILSHQRLRNIESSQGDPNEREADEYDSDENH
mmetsp:Transcript_32739/g.43095  ORF Transcript_32739/g.43095 Transcript_32739/m.43095 type:complete len:393 (-) Transcript_32739:183-1361(-)